jgi:RNA polymerase sigma-70 factor (ECF subfamily)
MNVGLSKSTGGLTAESLEELGRAGYALALQLLRHREDAADAVQDALQRLVQKRGLFDARRGTLRAWFLKIVRNRSLDLLRRRKRHRCDAADVVHVPAPARQRPDATVAEAELLNLVRKTLEDMPEPQREIILLRDFHQLSYAEIAEVLSIRSGTVMSRLHRARLELRQRLEQLGLSEL